jgi:Ni,Fe-hydrogenase III large subunit
VRACGLPRDVRHDYPSGFYALHQVPVANASDGDVYARALVRRIEVLRAYDFVSEALRQLPEGEALRTGEPLRSSRIAVSLVEGWRGEVVHIGITDASGELTRYTIVDPSRHNWSGVSAAMSGQQISDFPLCNKSFNLSYAGHDR